MAIDVTTKTWRSLTQLKKHIELNVEDEEVISFDGAFLTTNKHVYGLVDSQLTLDNEVQDNRQKVFKKGKVVSERARARFDLVQEKVTGKKKVAKKKATKKKVAKKKTTRRKKKSKSSEIN